MRILMIRSAEALGGAEIYNLKLIKGFKKLYPEVKFSFITTSPEFKKLLEKEGATAFCLASFPGELGTKRGLIKFITRLPKYLITYLKLVLEINKINKLDLICLQSVNEKIFLTPLLKIFNFRVVWLEHGPFFSFNISRIVKLFYKFSTNFSDKIITVSNDTKNSLIKEGIKNEKIINIYTGIDVDYFAPLTNGQKMSVKSNLGITNDEYIIGYLGAICQEKGIADFISVAKIISQRINNVKFLLVGGGEELSKIKKSLDDNLKSKFIFTDFKKDIRSYLGLFDIFFFPTNHLEGLSLALLEAMAMEKFVLVRDIGGIREIIGKDKSVGYLFRDETKEELTTIIINFLKTPLEKEKIGKNARARVIRYFNLKTWITNLYNISKNE